MYTVIQNALFEHLPFTTSLSVLWLKAKSAVDILLTCRYGVLMSSSLHVSFFMLLSALVLTIFNQAVDEGRSANTFSQKWTDVYKVNLGLSYVLVATYLIQSFVLWAGQRMSACNAATSGEHDANVVVLADSAMHSRKSFFFISKHIAYIVYYMLYFLLLRYHT